jgi:hypothetical protein
VRRRCTSRWHWCSASCIRNAKIQGELTRHWHAGTGEFFPVPDGQLTIQMRDRNVVLTRRKLFVVRGVEHCPQADTETAALLFEPGTVINTGDADGELRARSRNSPEGLCMRGGNPTRGR